MRCSLCPGVNKCLPPDGLVSPNRVLLIGEAPGKLEQDKGRVFIGKTGEELNRQYLPLAGLRREFVTIANAISCFPISAKGKLNPEKQKDLDLLDSCAEQHLYPLIQQMRPKLIVAMGSFACKAIDRDIDLELMHGIPQETHVGTVVPMYHPSLGIHEPKRVLLLRNDWIKLKKILAGTYVLPKDEYPNPDYQVADASMVVEDLENMQDQPIACDTETKKGGEPFCLTYSVRPGTGRLIRAEDKETLAVFQTYIDEWKAEILWHNWLFDYKVTKAINLKFPRNRIIDTMLRVFHLGNLPQGLKALARRELGVTMKDFDDVVTPASKELVLQYYRDCYSSGDWGRPDEQLIRNKEGEWKIYKPQSFTVKLKRFFTDYNKAPDTKDVFDVWDNWKDQHEAIEAQMGPWPGKCISYAPFYEVLTYACRDSDVLLRFWPQLKRMRSNIRKKPQYDWNEV